MERVRDLWRPREGDRERDVMADYVCCDCQLEKEAYKLRVGR